MREIWKLVPGNHRYEVSDTGRVRNAKTGKVLSQWPHYVAGHLLVNLSRGKRNSYKKWYAHRLVMLAFVGPCPEGLEVNHINGNAGDNRLSNLEYVTHKENMRHAHRTGLIPRFKGGKLNEMKVKEIREKHATGDFTYVSLAEIYSIDPETARRVVLRMTWQHI